MGETEDKRMKIIWLSVVLMIAVSIIVGFFVPAVGFWGGVGIFLLGIGLISLFLVMFMGKRESPIFPICLTAAGAILIINIILPILSIGLPWFILVAIAVAVLVVGAILFIVFKKK
ncbi:MAG: hypothetical protein Q4Q53_08510 [Methanocorpusculum sp.]|nr:hypothetical protein [Methanocorpusculum sp.]